MDDPKAGERQGLWYWKVSKERRRLRPEVSGVVGPAPCYTGAREGRANVRKPLDLGAGGT
jgi:hypothetical protein